MQRRTGSAGIVGEAAKVGGHWRRNEVERRLYSTEKDRVELITVEGVAFRESITVA